MVKPVLGDVELKVNSELMLIEVKNQYNTIPENLLGKIKLYTSLTIKRIIDIIGAIVGVLFLIPITVVIAIVNFINKEDGPIFYTQERIGKDGKLFKMYKFRTMVVGADEILEKLLNENEEAKEEYSINKTEIIIN